MDYAHFYEHQKTHSTAMKPNLLFVTHVLSIAFLALSGCQKEQAAPPTTCRITSLIESSASGTSQTTIQYFYEGPTGELSKTTSKTQNSNGVTVTEGTWHYEYEPGRVTITGIFSSKPFRSKQTLALDIQGRVTEEIKESAGLEPTSSRYEYDSEGYLRQISTGTVDPYISKYMVSNGYLQSVESSNPNQSFTVKIDQSSDFHQPVFLSWFIENRLTFPFLGKQFRGIPQGFSFTNGGQSFDYTNTFDPKGTLIRRAYNKVGPNGTKELIQQQEYVAVCSEGE